MFIEYLPAAELCKDRDKVILRQHREAYKSFFRLGKVDHVSVLQNSFTFVSKFTLKK